MTNLFSLVDNTIFALVFPRDLILICGVMAVIALLAFFSKALNFSGCCTAWILGVVVLYSTKTSGFFLFLMFFVLGSLSSVVSSKIAGRNSIESKGHRRDYMQVIANGFTVFLASFWFFVSDDPKALFLFGGAVAEAASDTWAGDFGRLSKQAPVSIVNFRKIQEKGVSGAVSPLGTLFAMIASLVFGVLWSFCFKIKGWGLVVFSGFSGCILDSVLGACAQALYRDKDGNLTEKPTDNLIKGIRWIDNDMVNLISNLFSGLLAVSLSIALDF